MSQQLTWCTGGYAHAHSISKAGGYGCDPCWSCGARPAAGATIWTNNYGDLFCNTCAQRKAVEHARAHKA